MKLISRTLGDICDEVRGTIRTGPFGSQLHESDYQDQGTPVVMPKDIIGGKISVENIARIGDDDTYRLSQHKLHIGDIVYGRRGDIGRRGFITKKEDGWICGTGCLRISLGAKVLNPKFLYYYLGDPRVITWIANQAIGATLPNLNTSIIRSIKVRYPSLQAQHKIAAILSAYDDLIENNTRRIAILEEMAQAIYREWFVYFRYPGHEKNMMVESELGMIPEGWQTKKLADICSCITDGSHWSPATTTDGYPMASVKDMHDWGFHTEQCRKISEEDYQKLVRSNCKPLKGDVLIAKDGSYLKHNFVLNKEVDLVILSSIAILRTNGQINQHILSLYLGDPLVKSRMKGYVSGVALPRIILKDFANFSVLVAPEAIQFKFIEIVEPIIAACYNFIERNNSLRLTRDRLLPKLISGEIDIEALDIDIPEIIEPEEQVDIPSMAQAEPIDATQLALPLL